MISLTPAEGPPHTFTISTAPRPAADTATCGAHFATTPLSKAAGKLARIMVAANVPDGQIEARGTDGRLRYTMRSLHAFALWRLREDPRFRVERWRPPHFADGHATSGRTAVPSASGVSRHPEAPAAAYARAAAVGVPVARPPPPGHPMDRVEGWPSHPICPSANDTGSEIKIMRFGHE